MVAAAHADMQQQVSQVHMPGSSTLLVECTVCGKTG